MPENVLRLIHIYGIFKSLPRTNNSSQQTRILFEYFQTQKQFVSLCFVLEQLGNSHLKLNFPNKHLNSKFTLPFWGVQISKGVLLRGSNPFIDGKKSKDDASNGKKEEQEMSWETNSDLVSIQVWVET